MSYDVVLLRWSRSNRVITSAILLLSIPQAREGVACELVTGVNQFCWQKWFYQAVSRYLATAHVRHSMLWWDLVDLGSDPLERIKFTDEA